MKLVTIELHKQSLIDAGLSVVGGLIGGVGTGAFLVHRWLRTQHHGATPREEGK